MTSAMTTPKQNATAKGGCNCGCSEPAGACCELDCISRPRFFCGQLLSDQDMTALVEWASGRLALSRFRHGWGVVCGLDVCCDPSKRSGVMVTPGYAIDPCGNDTIVCAETSLDLSSFCTASRDCCQDFGPPKPVSDDTVEFGGFFVPAAEVRMVDIYVRYRTEPADFKTALGRGVCRQTASCEPTRERESAELVARPVEGLVDPVQSAADAWLKKYQSCSKVIEAFTQQFGWSEKPQPQKGESVAMAGTRVRDWFLHWIEKHPLGSFCFLRDWMCSQPMDAFLEPDLLVRILFLLVQDCRNQFLSAACAGGDSGEGVPLARVWLRSRTTPKPDCRVLSIDAYPPYRRPVNTGRWPAPLGSVNLAQVVWHRLPEACAIMSDLGVDIGQTPVEFVLPPTVEELAKRLTCSPFFECGSEPVLQYYKFSDTDWRVVGFCGNRFQKNLPPLNEPKDALPPDDLTRLMHIRDKRAKALADEGVVSFQQVADMKPEKLQEIFPQMNRGPLEEIIESAKARLVEQRGGGAPQPQ